MCGIAGIIGKGGFEEPEKSIRMMTDLVKHRGPDGEGFYCDKKIAFGHRRLSIIDLSDFGKQPMTYQDKFVLIYNGEIYNYIEIREELSNAGFQFHTKTDTEVILAAYDKWGEHCVNHFNGMWSFALYDKIRNIVFCSRDRFGVKPFYYLETENAFYFGSEIKQLLPFIKQRKVNRSVLINYLVLGLEEYSSDTFFENIKSLLPSHNLIFDIHIL